jgi:hypothetical protein
VNQSSIDELIKWRDRMAESIDWGNEAPVVKVKPVWEYEERTAKIGECRLTHKVEEGSWTWMVYHQPSNIRISGYTKTSSRAEELSINAANWLNAGMPATQEK